jgi:arylsulfatase A-like enzyme
LRERSEKNTQWEGGYRVPCLIRWPGVIKPGTIINDIGAHEDMVPTLMAAVGATTVKGDLLKGKTIGDVTYKVHLDGYNLMPVFKGESEWPRHEFIYWTDDGNCAALRYNNWKVSFLKQEAHGIDVWRQPFVELRAPLISNLRMDPLERAEYEGMDYDHWYVDHIFVLAPAARISRSGCKASVNFRNARNLAVLTSTASWRQLPVALSKMEGIEAVLSETQIYAILRVRRRADAAAPS